MPIYTDRWFEVGATDTTPHRPTTHRPTTSEIITVIKDLYTPSMPTSNITQNLQEIIEACISAK